MNTTTQVSNRTGKRRLATHFALAGALAATPIALITGTAQASPTAIHHDDLGDLTPLPEPAYTAPGPEQVPAAVGTTYSFTVISAP
ncbi:hypothetical protein [Rhodococcus sp. IEGM 1379]|uniref:hypothetical protein n=1 Tax=Rhodococcus sp. IEGM 1379 TaxID=3047086 RepID=UPI0024B79334|nr:hypothetical protein [Rhodococcus sp. IEGM 1379]MDI9915702.1 hypothetical protein [Rhodococcus sp. IEGM 1379]